MKFYIKPETNRDAEMWDSGWRMGLLLGISITLLALGIIISCIK